MPELDPTSTNDICVAVPGARLHVQVRGSGPPLLILQSGEGDADRSVDLGAALEDRFTVISHDRRGLSRSVRDQPDEPVSLAQHADDVHRLLVTVADRPVVVVGCSLGAVIGLHLVLRHPTQVALLIAHEPVAPNLLPHEDRRRHLAELEQVRACHLRSGLAAALPAMAETLGIRLDGQEAEPDLTPQPMTTRREENFDHFLRYDVAALAADSLEPDGLIAHRQRILPAVGRSTPGHVFDGQCGRALGRLLGQEPVVLPGGHNGNLTHPRAWAAALTHLIGTRALW